eukprot:NODE_2380_length_1076_cov_123.733404_g2362_i0.p1 GENE.NODE_2380_length_1076_cov_123.733404_g2362_i0~~NODE_2380_length_1076_cov_123.733404_g2362_i0.p1  ORF type:complete len:242 (+),score=16.93 NODE_2380_length_1076_cov_123.733404_g2362_i0:63-788(+)
MPLHTQYFLLIAVLCSLTYAEDCVATFNGKSLDLSSIQPSQFSGTLHGSAVNIGLDLCAKTQTICDSQDYPASYVQTADNEQNCYFAYDKFISFQGSVPFTALTVVYTQSNPPPGAGNMYVKLACDEKGEQGVLTMADKAIISQPQQPVTIALLSRDICIFTGIGGGNPWGLAFCLTVMILAILYFGVGMGWNYKRNEKRGVEMVPHVDFWKDLPFLCKDGFMFMIHGFRRCCCKGSYSEV